MKTYSLHWWANLKKINKNRKIIERASERTWFSRHQRFNLSEIISMLTNLTDFKSLSTYIKSCTRIFHKEHEKTLQIQGIPHRNNLTLDLIVHRPKLKKKKKTTS